MEESIKTVFKGISEEKYTVKELSVLVQYIAQELNLKTTSNYAKDNNMSYNGVKKHRPYILIDGVKFHVEGIDTNNLPF